MNLYLLTTRGLGEFYCVANDPTQAETMLTRLLDRANYGVFTKRRVVNIQWLSQSKADVSAELPMFSHKESNLLIYREWMDTIND